MTDQTTTTPRVSGSATLPSADPGMSGAAKDQAREAADTGKHEAGRVVDEARMQTSRLVGETGERAREHADEQLGRTAGVIDKFGSELDDMAAHSSDPDGYVAALVRDGARSAHRLSQRLDSDGLDGVVEDVTRFARRRPGAFLAASFAVGIVLGRVTRNADFGRIKQEMSGDGDDAADDAGVSTGWAGGPVTSAGISP